MKKLITKSELLLLGVGKFFDLIEEIRDPFHLLENYYENYLGLQHTKYTRSNSYQLVWRNLRTNNIEKIIENGEVFYRLTRKGKKKIYRKFPLLQIQKKTWDRKWRLAIYDIEEKRKSVRDAVRLKLIELGFAMLQESVWISPHDFLKDLQEFLDTSGLLGNVILIETENFYIEDIVELSARLWNLEEIEQEYVNIRIEFEKLKKETSYKKSGDRLNKLERLMWRILQVYLKDPFLPKELLPHDWMGEKIQEIIKEFKLLK